MKISRRKVKSKKNKILNKIALGCACIFVISIIFLMYPNTVFLILNYISVPKLVMDNVNPTKKEFIDNMIGLYEKSLLNDPENSSPVITSSAQIMSPSYLSITQSLSILFSFFSHFPPSLSQFPITSTSPPSLFFSVYEEDLLLKKYYKYFVALWEVILFVCLIICGFKII
jgi:hypothetical protein